MKTLSPYTLVMLLFMVPTAWAESMSLDKLYFGGGGGSASLPQRSTPQSALQFFVGYPFLGPWELSRDDHYRFNLEMGYVDIGNSEQDVIWVTPSVTRYVNGYLDLVLRAGMEKGTDAVGQSGALAALGLDYKIDSAITTRLEYVKRPDGSVVFINLVYRP
jgi:hypothetical protein